MPCARSCDDENRAVMLISHKLDEILHATDRVTIMRDGAVVARVATAETDAGRARREMIGRATCRADVVPPSVTSSSTDHRHAAGAIAKPANESCSRSATRRRPRPDGRTLLDRLHLDVRAGEILGLAGAEGNGQAPLGDLLSSLLPLTSGSVEVGGAAVRCRHARARWPPRASASSPKTGDSALDPRALGRREPRHRRHRSACAADGSSTAPRLRARAAAARRRVRDHDRVGRRADALALGRQPAAGRARARAVAPPVGARRRAADARARRRRDRIHDRAPPRGRGRAASRAAHLDRARRARRASPTASR